MSQGILDSSMLSVGSILNASCVYTFDYYQRKYAWTEDNINDLINDLVGEFQNKYSTTMTYHRDEFPSYFLGTIMVTKVNSREYSVIDGQQRLTSLTLILLALRSIFKKSLTYNPDLTDIISSLSSSLYTSIDGNNRQWHVERKEAQWLLEEILDSNTVINLKELLTTASQDVVNIFERYNDILDYFENQTEMTTDKGLIDFSYWLLNNVKLNRIVTETESQAYKIFETQNDRGLSLAPYDMLKAFLLSKIKDKNKLEKATEIWDKEIEKLAKVSRKTVSDFFRDYLRSQYTNFTDSVAGQIEYDRFATEYHRWVSENLTTIMRIETEDDIYDFIVRTLPLYIKTYLKLLSLSKTYDYRFSSVFYNAQQAYLLQNMFILSAIKAQDKDEIIDEKIKKTSLFIEIFITRLIWEDQQWKPNYTKFEIVKKFMPAVRNNRNTVESLTAILKQLLEPNGTSFKFGPPPVCTGSNRKFIRNVLARITDIIQIAATSNNGLDYSKSVLKDYTKYEIEHIMADKWEQWSEEFNNDIEAFQKARNELGSLLLLPKSENASFNDMPYNEKVKKYGYVSNYLAKTLSEDLYNNENTELAASTGLANLKRFANQHQIHFTPYPQFGEQAKNQRNMIYRTLADIVWSVNRI